MLPRLGITFIMKLTKESIKKLTLPPGKPDAIYFDDDLKGFGVRLRAGGKKTWIAQYRFGVKQKRITLGTVNKPSKVEPITATDIPLLGAAERRKWAERAIKRADPDDGA
jgi:hypothetical protein